MLPWKIPRENTQGVQALTLTKLPTHSMSIMSSVLMCVVSAGADLGSITGWKRSQFLKFFFVPDWVVDNSAQFFLCHSLIHGRREIGICPQVLEISPFLALTVDSHTHSTCSPTSSVPIPWDSSKIKSVKCTVKKRALALRNLLSYQKADFFRSYGRHQKSPRNSPSSVYTACNF